VGDKALKALLENDCYSHLPTKFRKEFMEKTTTDLLQILENMTTRAYVEEKYGDFVDDSQEDHLQYEMIRYEVLFRLGLIDQGDIIALVKTYVNELEEKLKEFMHEHKNHRHKSILGTYSEKPVY